MCNSRQWTVGALCAVIGALMLTTPQDVQATTDTVLSPHLLWLGAALLLAGAGLLSVAAVRASVAGELHSRLAARTAECERAEAKLRLLIEAGDRLDTEPDPETTLRTLAGLVVPTLADWCSVHLVRDDGSIDPLVVAHVDSSKVERAHEIQARYPLSSGKPWPLLNVLRTGRPELGPEISDELLKSLAEDADHLKTLRELGLTSFVIAPLLARGQTLGSITLVAAESGHHYDEADLQFAEDLARRAALAVDNARLYGEARAAVKAREDFLSAAAHDLKNPLTTIKGLAQLLQHRIERLDSPETSKISEGLVKIDGTATKMGKLLNEMVDVTRLQVGRPLELERRTTDLVSLARQAAADHQQRTDSHRIRLDVAEPELVGHWDTARLERVLDNILGNAIKYSPNGGDIYVRLAREEDGDNAWALLAVRDQGLGIPATDRERVFERFQRGDDVVRKITGSGIGLAGARQIVEQHGGTIAVASEDGDGTTFTVRLPLPAVEGHRAGAGPRPPSQRELELYRRPGAA